MRIKTVGADVGESRYQLWGHSHHCRYLSKRRVVVIVSTGETGQTRWKVKLSTTRDTTTSEWSRLFLNECFIASSRPWEDIGRRWLTFYGQCRWNSVSNSGVSSCV